MGQAEPFDERFDLHPLYRELSLVTVAGRRFSPAVASFVRAIRADPWPAFASRKTGDAGRRTRDGRARSGNRPPCQQGVGAI